MMTLNPDMEKHIEAMDPGTDYWSLFLKARAKLIAACREAGKTDEEIYEMLWMDGPEHVNRIRHSMSIP